MQAHHPYRHLLAHFEIFWDILRHLEKIGAIFSNFEQFGAVFVGPVWVISSNFEHFCRASLGHVEQFWTIFGSTIWHCWPWTVFKMSQLRLLWDILLWLKKVADVNPTDLDPKTRSVNLSAYGKPAGHSLCFSVKVLWSVCKSFGVSKLRCVKASVCQSFGV